MVHHIVMWNLKEELSAEEKKQAALLIKQKLEAVAEKAQGIISLKVEINEMDSSNKDVALISCFESEEALQAYQISPAHKEAGAYVGSVACKRSCFDYKE